MKRLPATLVLLLSAGSALSGCSTDDGAAQSDEVVSVAGTVALDGAEATVVLPSGVFTITVTDPRDVVPADDAADDVEHEAPEGQTYVGVGWAQSGNAPAFGPILHGTTPQPATLRVRSGEEVVDAVTIDTQEGSGDGAWVLVPDDLSDSVAEIVYDGQVQSVDLVDATVEPRVAAGLYDIQSLPTDCPDDEVSDAQLSYTISCTTSVATATPYVAELGWASAGEGWLVLDLELQPSTFRWKDGASSGRFTVDAQRGDLGSAEVLLASEDLPADGYGVTIAVPATVGVPTDLDITRTYDLTRSGAGSPTTTRATYDVTLHLPALPGKD